MIFMMKKLVKVSLSRLPTNVEPREESYIIFRRSNLLLTIACSLRTRTSKYLELVARNDIIDGLGSVNQTLGDNDLKLLFTRHSNLPDILDS